MKTFLAYITEATRQSSSNKKAGFASKWKKLIKGVKHIASTSKDEEDTYAARDTLENPWLLTGHIGNMDMNDEIQRVKDKVFGKRGSRPVELFFYTDEGIITFPVQEDMENITHRDYMDSSMTRYLKGKSKKDHRKLLASKMLAKGRIEHHAKDTGIISLISLFHNEKLPSFVVRAVQKAYPKYTVHDGNGKEFTQKI